MLQFEHCGTESKEPFLSDQRKNYDKLETYVGAFCASQSQTSRVVVVSH